eukprot:TRINITY_DN131_c0_g1_i1.p1 TRINITY_DN131_c0_g1~~TRINITY_DN131_c0_g1_i1.p1  ORF type:complete len:450 (-),score=114.98 TRINITY_DN131_c0_g1_i1:53-1348(-)
MACEFDDRSKRCFSYGKHFPQGVAAVEYLHGPEGTCKPLTNLTYVWNYYPHWATGNHPFDKGALINHANGQNHTTCRDANGHVLLDFNKDGEPDATEGGCAFHEHNAKGLHNETRGAPFSNFWFDDNILAAFMCEAYGKSLPHGLHKYEDFVRWRILGGDTTGWAPYNQDFFDTLALDGLFHLATNNVPGAVECWDRIKNGSGAAYDETLKRYVYPNVHENYHLAAFKILNDKLSFLGTDRTQEMIQHFISLNSTLLANQEKHGGNPTGWRSNINEEGSLINTESVALGALALGGGGVLTYQAGFHPLQSAGGHDYEVHPDGVFSAVVGKSKEGHMTYGPHDHLEPANYVVDFYLRSSAPGGGGVAHVDVYDSKTDSILGDLEVNDYDLAPGQWGRFSVNISLEGENDLEYRAWWRGGCDLDIALIQIRKA